MKKKKTGKLQVISRFLKGNLHMFVLVFIFSMLHTVFNSLTPQIVRISVDSVIGGEKWNLPAWLVEFLHLESIRNSGWQALFLAGGAIIISSILSGICNYVSKMEMAKGSESFVKNIRDQLYEHIQRLPFSWHVKHQTGEIIQRCTSDVEVVKNFVCNQMVEVFRITFLIVLYMGIMFSMNVKITLVAFVFIPIVIGYSGIFYSKIAKKFQVADEAEGELSSVVQENLTGVRVVRAFGKEKFEIDRFDVKNEKFSNLWIKLGNLMCIYWGLGDLMTGFQVLAVICAGVVTAVNGGITLGEFMAFVSYNATLIWPVRSLGRILSDMSKAGVSIERVAYILDAEEEQNPESGAEPSMNQDIRFEHINFSYGTGYPVLKDVDFTIPAGKTFAILGGTGSGKSTLVHLLNRLYDLPEDSGRITIGGVDIAEIDRGYLRKNIGMVLQEPFLFSREIGENIAITQMEKNEEEIYAAARIACVDDAIRSFHHGYETIVGERGVTLSGGQKQRVAIARMLMQKAPIMVFDDSLSAVDAETDAKIREALQEEMGKATVILISHRITTLMQADCILVLDDGKVAQMGTHEELIHQEGIYRSIYEIQMNSEDRKELFESSDGQKEGEC
ncbi:MAG: ABC transporter ATP-binding protein [Clostridiales bacterium]|nr:ABC transporter ATP-binding protein [Clostridiales bacterium]